MGTDKRVFVGVERGGGVTGSHASHMTSQVTGSGSRPEEALSESMLCACATASCTISALVGPFDRK